MEDNIVALVVARMGSTRFPGKTLADLHGRPMLERLIERVEISKYIDTLMVATTNLPADDAIEHWCHSKNIFCFRGSSSDVLGRLWQASKHVNASAIVEILGDNPLVHSSLIERAIEVYREKAIDYVATLSTEYPGADSNLPRFPIGVRVQVLSSDALRRCNDLVHRKEHREHATSFIAENPDKFSTALVSAAGEFSDCDRPELTFAVNFPENLDLIRKIFSKCYPTDHNFTVGCAIRVFDEEPTIHPMMGMQGGDKI